MTTRRRASAFTRGSLRSFIRGSAAGFTIIEMIVAIGIFIAMGAALVTLMHLGLEQWRKGERRRRVYEQAQSALGQLGLDLEAAFTREPAPRAQSGGVGHLPTARFFCTGDGGLQRLSFVRTFEAGPERAFVFDAGAGKETYTDGFVGDPRDLTAIGGLVGVTYFLGGSSGRELRRATLGPPAPARSSLLCTTGSQEGEVLTGNVLYLGFRFRTQTTVTWDDPPPGTRPGRKAWRWPETVWDSTRGARVQGIEPTSGRKRPFALARGPESLLEPTDDVFPEVVETTLVIEADDARALRTDLARALSVGDSEVRVASTRGFVDPSMGPPYLLVGGTEWIRYKAKGKRSFEVSARGLRGTKATAHRKGADVRAGTTFVMRAHVPGWRADWTSDADFIRKARE